METFQLPGSFATGLGCRPWQLCSELSSAHHTRKYEPLPGVLRSLRVPEYYSVELLVQRYMQCMRVTTYATHACRMHGEFPLKTGCVSSQAAIHTLREHSSFANDCELASTISCKQTPPFVADAASAGGSNPCRNILVSFKFK